MNGAKMKPMRYVLLCAFALSAALGAAPATAATMYNYCQVPPYVIQNVAPNIMIILDSSLSMRQLAYVDNVADGSGASGGLCNIDTAPCVDFRPARTDAYGNWNPYYGYFNPKYWYSYAGGVFSKRAPKDNTAKISSDWDGNFLNWLTMRRIDVVRKALTGGKASGSYVLSGESPTAAAIDGHWKRISSAQNYTPYNGNTDFYLTSQGSGTAAVPVIEIQSGTRTDRYSVQVQEAPPIEGVMQKRIGARARVGLEFYDSATIAGVTGEGGDIRWTPASGSLSGVINEANLTPPSAAGSPIGEALYTATGLFALQNGILPCPTGVSNCGPIYRSGSVTLTDGNDPFNYGSAGQPRYPPCAQSFVLYITDGEPCLDENLPAAFDYSTYSTLSPYVCNGSFCPGDGISGSPYASGSSITSSGCTEGAVSGVEKVALWSHVTDLRNRGGGLPDMGYNNIPRKQNLTLYIVNAFGQDSQLLRYAAINGGFEDNGSGRPDAWTGQHNNWDGDGNGVPDTYFLASDGAVLESALDNALTRMLRRASSGTAASVLASGEGQGANLIQAVFYPRRAWGSNVVSWTGSLQNLWYYVDPFFSNSSIREDSNRDKALKLSDDRIAQLYFDATADATKAKLFRDANGDGVADSSTPEAVVGFEYLDYLWEAGKKLWAREVRPGYPGYNPRKIYTSLDNATMIPVAVDNAAALQGHLMAGSPAEAENIIRYVNGEDIADNTVRSRTVSYGSAVNVWKLGDIINSTPRISSWIPLNKYWETYGDAKYRDWTQDNATAASYRRRGIVLAGGNDGVLHAFKLGDLQVTGLPADTKAILRNNTPSTGDMGDELWAFIPKNVLPYLKYQMNPDYCHVYTTDLSPFVFDASVGGTADDPISDNTASWRTIVIGGMRTGGGCRPPGAPCTEGAGASTTCVKTPDADKGFSSYFALDVTDQNDPKILWEFTHPNLGFSTTGPAIVKIHAQTAGLADRSKNGHWFAVFGSGPTGPIDNNYMQFLGRSDQQLTFFVVDIRTGEVRTINGFYNGLFAAGAISNAFSGSLYNAASDANLDYQDDVIYFGYTQRAGLLAPYTWTAGGVGRIVTKNDPDPRRWSASTIATGIGPVTSGIARLKNPSLGTFWLFFGAGRYYYDLGYRNADDMLSRRDLFGIKEPCYRAPLGGIDPACTDKLASSTTDFTDVTTDTAYALPIPKGWHISLDPAGSYAYDNATSQPYYAERVITDTVASTSGLAFFTTFKPYAEECGLGGKTFIWAARYDTGGAPGELARGEAIVQSSIAAIEQLEMKDEFNKTGPGRDPRKSTALEGVPPTAQGLTLLTPPPPLNRILHIRER